MLKTLAAQIKQYKKSTILTPIFAALEVVMEVLIPMAMARLVKYGIEGGDTGAIYRYGFLMMAMAMLSLGFGSVCAHTASHASTGFAANLRDGMYSNIQRFSFANIDNYSTAGLVTRMTTDITVIQNAMANGFRPCVRGPMMLIMSLVYAFSLNRELAMVFVCILPVLALALGVITWRVSPLYQRLQTSMDHVNRVVQENLPAVRAYGREPQQCDALGSVNSELAQGATKTFGTAQFNLPVFQAAIYTAATLVLWEGGQKNCANTLTVGELTGFMSYVLQVMNSLMMLSNVFLLLKRALSSVERVGEILDEEPLIASPAAAHALTAVPDGSVSFRDVTFKYRAEAEEDVLEGISFDIASGSTVGILGSTGAGKSSLVQLIARLYDATAGEVLVGGRDVREYDLAVLRDAVGVVLQKNVLFTGSARDNLRWGNAEATDEELLEACRLACVDEFLDRIGGLDGDLGQGGAGVSGGQKQRLCIARALLKRPRNLIFDASTNAVDMATEAKIRANLASIPGVTCIIIAQRITSVMDADKIIVLDDGHLHAQGTHAELLETDAIYKEISASQVGHSAKATPDDY